VNKTIAILNVRFERSPAIGFYASGDKEGWTNRW